MPDPAWIIALALQAQLQIEPPPDLPAPPMLETLLFERPLPALVGLAVVAAAVGYAGVSRARKPMVVAAAAILLLGAGLFATAASVTTDRERVLEGSRRLVDAVAGARVSELDALLDRDARLLYFVTPAGLDKPGILERVGRDMTGPYRVREHTVQDVQAARDGPDLARTQVKVTVVPESTGFPHLSYWRLDWRRGPDGTWRVFSIEPLAIAGVADARGR